MTSLLQTASSFTFEKYYSPFDEKQVSNNNTSVIYPEYTDDDAGFQIATLPISAGALGRFPAIEVKLNGETANINPSKGLYSNLL